MQNGGSHRRSVGCCDGPACCKISSQAGSKVSAVMAVSGNSDSTKHTSHVSNVNFPRIETALGIHHAVSGKKNLFLMTSSFALSIILFLSFSVMIDLVGYIMPQSSGTAGCALQATMAPIPSTLHC